MKSFTWEVDVYSNSAFIRTWLIKWANDLKLQWYNGNRFIYLDDNWDITYDSGTWNHCINWNVWIWTDTPWSKLVVDWHNTWWVVTLKNSWAAHWPNIVLDSTWNTSQDPAIMSLDVNWNQQGLIQFDQNSNNLRICDVSNWYTPNIYLSRETWKITTNGWIELHWDSALSSNILYIRDMWDVNHMLRYDWTIDWPVLFWNSWCSIWDKYNIYTVRWYKWSPLLKTSTTAVADADMFDWETSFYLDETNNKLKIKVKYSDWTIKYWEVALA